MKLINIIAAVLLISLVGCGGGGGSSSESAPSKPAPNNPPVANSDTIEVGMNVSTELDVLANDSDVDSFTVASVTEASNGSVLQNDHNIIYTPTDGFVGNDSFSYTIKDSIGQEATATVNLTVYNIAPTAVDDLVQTQQGSMVEIDVLANDLSVGKHQLTVISTSVPEHGSVELKEGVLTYTPTSGFAGEDSFIYIIEDSLGDEATASVTVDISNVIPTANDDEASIKQNESITVDVLGNDSDALGDVLTILSLDGVSHGSASIENNKIVYSPNAGYAGAETINYTVSDGYDGQNEAKLTVYIDNIEPTASDDSVYILKNNSIAIDVLANDKDVINDTLTIQSVSAANHGVVTIVDGKLNYQPITDYVGDDEFEYTLVDSHGASDTAIAEIKVRNAIQLQGKLVGYEQQGLKVVIKNGEQELTATTDAEGNYAVELTEIVPDNLIIAYVNNVTENYNLRAYFGGIKSLLFVSEDNTNFIVDKNITDLTTAEYELIDLMRDGNEASTADELIKAQFEADSFYQLQMTIAAMLINQDNGLGLPGAFSTVNEFIKSTKIMNKQLAIWRENNSGLYRQAYTDLSNDSELSSYPIRLTEGLHFLIPSTGGRTLDRQLSTPASVEFASGSLTYSLLGKVSTASDWQKTGNQLKFFLNNSSTPVTESQYLYCSDGVNKKFYFEPVTIELTQIYSTEQYTVYLQKSEAAEAGTHCNSDVSTFYKTVRHYFSRELPKISGHYYLNTLHNRKNIFSDTYSIRSFAALINFNDDGTFVESLEISDELTGNWQIIGDELVLNYPDNTSIRYQYIADYYGIPRLFMTHMQDGVFDKRGSSAFLIAKTDIKMPSSVVGNWNFYNNERVLDSQLAQLDPHRLNLNADNTGEVQYLSADTDWQTRSGDYWLFTWRVVDNFMYHDYYKLDGVAVNYCDVVQDNCYINDTDEFEIIADSDGIYFTKYIYNFFDETGSLLGSSSGILPFKFVPH